MEKKYIKKMDDLDEKYWGKILAEDEIPEIEKSAGFGSENEVEAEEGSSGCEKGEKCGKNAEIERFSAENG